VNEPKNRFSEKKKKREKKRELVGGPGGNCRTYINRAKRGRRDGRMGAG